MTGDIVWHGGENILNKFQARQNIFTNIWENLRALVLAVGEILELKVKETFTSFRLTSEGCQDLHRVS